MNVDLQTSSHSFPMEISAPDCRCRKMCTVFSLVDNKGLRLSYALLVACMRLPSGRITCGPCVVFTLLLQCLYTFI